MAAYYTITSELEINHKSKLKRGLEVEKSNILIAATQQVIHINKLTFNITFTHHGDGDLTVFT